MRVPLAWFLLLVSLFAISSLGGRHLKHQHDKNKEKDIYIIVGLPKTGTTALHDAFLDLGIQSIHHHVPYTPGHVDSKSDVSILCPDDAFPIPAVTVGGNSTPVHFWHEIPQKVFSCYVGMVVQRAIVRNQDPLHFMLKLGYTAFAQLDVCYPPNVCIHPQFEAIEEITNAYPRAYYIHTRRITVDVHVGSLTAWRPGFGGPLIDRMRSVGYLSMFPSQTPNQTDVDNLKHFVREVTKETVQFFEHRPWLHFLDVAIEDPQAADKIGAFLHIDNFTLPKANAGVYAKGLTASPTPANFSRSFDHNHSTTGDDADDDSEPHSHPPSASVHQHPASDDDEPDTSAGGAAAAAAAGSGAAKTSPSSASTPSPTPNLTSPTASAPNPLITRTGETMALTGTITAGPVHIDVFSLVLGMLLSSFLHGLCGRASAARSMLRRRGGVSADSGSRDVRGKIKYSPLPSAERGGVRGIGRVEMRDGMGVDVEDMDIDGLRHGGGGDMDGGTLFDNDEDFGLVEGGGGDEIE